MEAVDRDSGGRLARISGVRARHFATATAPSLFIFRLMDPDVGTVRNFDAPKDSLCAGSLAVSPNCCKEI